MKPYLKEARRGHMPCWKKSWKTKPSQGCNKEVLKCDNKYEDDKGACERTKMIKCDCCRWWGKETSLCAMESDILNPLKNH